jgi:hypothetical protein
LARCVRLLLVARVITHVPQLSFTDQQLIENIEYGQFLSHEGCVHSLLFCFASAFIKTVTELKPAGSKGTYFNGSLISCTNGKAIPLDIRQPPFKCDALALHAGYSWNLVVVRMRRPDRSMSFHQAAPPTPAAAVSATV